MQMIESAKRFQDAGETIYSYMDEILVECPRCRACARVFRREPDENAATHLRCFQPRRVVCESCGFTKDWQGNSLHFDGYADPMRDSYFRLSLWLQTPCCGHTLWAYNRRHLRLIEDYVQADLREHTRDPKWGWSNQALANRLPEWMIIAKHREPVLKAIAKLKAK